MNNPDDYKVGVTTLSFFYTMLHWLESLKKAPPFFEKFLQQAIEQWEDMSFNVRELTEQLRMSKEEATGWKASAMEWEKKANQNNWYSDTNKNYFFARHAHNKMLARCNDWLKEYKFSTFDNDLCTMSGYLDNLCYYFVAGEEGSFISEAINAFGVGESTKDRPSMYSYVKENWFKD